MLDIITYLSNNITNFLCKKEVINLRDKSIYQYGCEVIISAIVGFTLILVTGVILEEILLSVVFLLVFVPLRMFTGGYHADNYLKCNIVFECLFLATIFSTRIFISYFTYPAVILFGVFSFITILCYAPIENENKPLTEEEKKKHKLTGAILCIFYEIIILLVYPLASKLSVTATITLFIVTVLILYQKVKDGNDHEKFIN
ncbi:accessory gene regulator B family protein [Paludicola sp. MB14-C6]|uniref:accessory gene regulator ArgB-like protein n=1 Tax=Paludihabitans sp. MB14-C6 TaxID=3070656 RepID=UPI0027DE7846|nr:accessory gene regulator B family protein [Paludicola sp. MB14-C6]WMJ22353.1 accessory gene regulator B family protein [Paludicola sp. MB14-C6]